MTQSHTTRFDLPPGRAGRCSACAVAPVGRPARRQRLVGVVLAVGVLLAAASVPAQWLTQTFTLKPGWNAIFTHVDASYQPLDTLLPDANGPVAEIWLWKPTFSTIQFSDTPYTNAVANSQWAVWTSAGGDTDTLARLVGNGAYLVNNRTAADFVWTVKGMAVPPSYQWTTTGLNFLGFPTPAGTAPSFANYLAPAPGLDLAKTLQNSARVFRYPGGNLGATNPAEVVSIAASTTPVTRGQAFWVRGSTDYYNRYYGPVEVALQSTAGIQYGDTLGTYSLRLKNLSSTGRTVTFSLVGSEQPPAGQPAIAATPQLLVRGALSTTTLKYEFAVLAGQQFTLAPAGQAGSELQVVLGLNRSAMTAAVGSLYAGILRIADSGNLQQIDVPVSATVPNASGLWVGQAGISQVGQYLKTYPKVDPNQANQADQINAAAAAANLPPSGAELPGYQFVPRETNFTRAYSSVASSLDGKTLVAAVSGGMLYVGTNYGTSNWTARAVSANWAELACSADGQVLAATVHSGPIHVSTDYGTNWVATASGSAAWVGLACSADGNRLAAVAQGGSLYTSSNRGASWVAQSGAGLRNWSSVAMSADGSSLVAAVNPGLLYTSADGGIAWRTNAFSAKWIAVAASADGLNLAAAVSGGQIYTSGNAGANWTGRTITETVVAAGVTNEVAVTNWTSVATSTDGRRLAATAKDGKVFTSDDGGTVWTARELNRNWDDIVVSGDATRLVAVVNGGAIYTLNRTFASYTVNADNGLVTDQNGLYLASGVNTNFARVGSPFPLRLILHHQADASQVGLLQQVFVGPGLNATNFVVTTRESLLDPAQLASARRITATHLPFSRNNEPWPATGNFNPSSVLRFEVAVSYKDQTSNPFLHTFHPDHDNLDANFKSVLARGVESYDLIRTILLTFNPPGDDFAALTAAAQSRAGTYEETMTIGGRSGAIRDFRLSGTFTLQLISPVAVLTKP